MSFEVTSTGNAGIQLEAGTRIFIDSFFKGLPFVGTMPLLEPASVTRADLILVTHNHPDHFNQAATLTVARQTGATVIGPAPVIAQLATELPARQLQELEPEAARTGCARSAVITLPFAKVTAFRTFHSKGHNSYLIETPSYRVFHDCDNEDTSRLDVKALGNIDALFLCPWQGSGCSAFVERLKPRYWFLIHMTSGEIQEHKAGTFLPGLCEKIPGNVVALNPGETFTVNGLSK